MDANGEPILVTGTHRSGTTWVGKTLALAPGVAYISEPFNPHSSDGVRGCAFPYWFTYVAEHNSDAYEESFRRMLAFRYSWSYALASPRSARSVARSARDASQFAWYRASRSLPLLKDPIAVFSVPWLVETFGVRPVVMMRHPAAFVASILRVGWEHPFDHFLAQDELMVRYLEPYRDAIERAAASPRPLLDQAVLLWNLINSVIAHYEEPTVGALIVRHEDIAARPAEGFADLYMALGLPETRQVTERIARQSSADNPTNALGQEPHQMARNSPALVKAWRTTLTATEIREIRAATEAVSSQWYADEDWVD